jgi:NAD-specific glutamate dehydrogenase
MKVKLTGVNIEGNLDLRNTLGSGRNTDEIEVAKEFVVPYELTLTLVNLDFDGGLAISSRREDLRFLGGDGRVARDEFCHDATKSFDT